MTIHTLVGKRSVPNEGCARRIRLRCVAAVAAHVLVGPVQRVPGRGVVEVGDAKGIPAVAGIAASALELSPVWIQRRVAVRARRPLEAEPWHSLFRDVARGAGHHPVRSVDHEVGFAVVTRDVEIGRKPRHLSVAIVTGALFRPIEKGAVVLILVTGQTGAHDRRRIGVPSRPGFESNADRRVRRRAPMAGRARRRRVRTFQKKSRASVIEARLDATPVHPLPPGGAVAVLAAPGHGSGVLVLMAGGASVGADSGVLEGAFHRRPRKRTVTFVAGDVPMKACERVRRLVVIEPVGTGPSALVVAVDTRLPVELIAVG